jgi:hypothetical protein
VLPDGTTAAPTYPPGRVCARQDCSVLLSIYNSTAHCAAHQSRPGSTQPWVGQARRIVVLTRKGAGNPQLGLLRTASSKSRRDRARSNSSSTPAGPTAVTFGADHPYVLIQRPCSEAPRRHRARRRRRAMDRSPHLYFRPIRVFGLPASTDQTDLASPQAPITAAISSGERNELGKLL